MKKVYTLLFPLILFGTLNAQQEIDNNSDDTTKIKIGNMTIIFGEDDEGDSEFDFDMEDDTLEGDCKPINALLEIGLGMNGWLTPSGTTTFSSEYQNMGLQLNKSRAFSMHVVLGGLDIAKEHLFISPGFGVTWNNYHFEDKTVSISTGADSTIFMSDTTMRFDKYKLRTTYIEVPLTVGARLGNPDDFHFTIEAGIIGGLNISSVVKQRTYVNEVKFKNKVKDDFNVNPFKLDAIVKLRVNEVLGIYGRYSLTTMFEVNKTQEVYPFSIGVTFGGI
jgi:hypothetical protein